MIDHPPACRDALAWLQARLDGEAAPMPGGVSAHIEGCVLCRNRFRTADDLLAVLTRREAYHRPTPLFTERVFAAVRTDTRRRRMVRWTAGSAAVAAGLVLAVWLGTRTTNSGRNADELTFSPPAIGPRAPSLRTELAEAGEAVIALTRRTAAETVSDGQLLLPTIELPGLATAAFSAATAPLGEARHGLSDGFEPVATSARRAVNLFLRDPPASGGVKEKKN